MHLSSIVGSMQLHQYDDIYDGMNIMVVHNGSLYSFESACVRIILPLYRS